MMTAILFARIARTLQIALATSMVLMSAVSAPLSAAPAVSLLKTPNGAIQPQAVLDASGVLHLVDYAGDPDHGDIFYVYKTLGKDEPFSSPLRGNSVAGSAVAIGTIRGAHLAVGQGTGSTSSGTEPTALPNPPKGRRFFTAV